MPFGFATAAAKPSPKGMRPDQLLGLYQAVTQPWDAGAMALENGAAKIGLPVDRIDAAFGTPSAADVAAGHKAYIDRQAAAGARPGLLGQFMGAAMLGPDAMAPPAAIPSVQATPDDPDGFVWSVLRKLAPGVGANPARGFGFAPPSAGQ